MSSTSLVPSAGATGDPQASTTLDSRVIAQVAANGSESSDPERAGLVSTNNFINYCLTVNALSLTNGTQNRNGSCNPVPMGMIPSSDHMPSVKFVFPTHGDDLAPDTPFELKIAVRNFETGFSTNSDTTYLSAPQQLDPSSNNVRGHVRIVFEQVISFRQSTTTDPAQFSFAKSIVDKAQSGILTTNISSGLPSGAYRLSSLVSTANRSPIFLPLFAHGAVDDAVYVTVGGLGRAKGDQQAPASSDSQVDMSGRFQDTSPPLGSQTSLILDQKVIAAGLSQDGHPATPDQVASLTSTNNYINFCLTTQKPLTNGRQVKEGSCNPTPMGVIPSATLMPAVKFTYPLNGDTIPAWSNFSVSWVVDKLFEVQEIDPDKQFMAAPQQAFTDGRIIGKVQFVIEALTAFNQTDPPDPVTHQSFQGNLAAQQVSLPPGFYRLSSIVVAANYQPALVPIAQHGSLNDVVYFEVTSDGSGGSPIITTTVQPQASASSSSGSDNGRSQSSERSAIIGGVLGGIVMVLIILSGVLYLRRRRRNRKGRPDNDLEEPQATSAVPFDIWLQRQPVSQFDSVPYPATLTNGIFLPSKSTGRSPQLLAVKQQPDIVSTTSPAGHLNDTRLVENPDATRDPGPDPSPANRVSVAETAPPPYQI